jgi:hypothetical protein
MHEGVERRRRLRRAGRSARPLKKAGASARIPSNAIESLRAGCGRRVARLGQPLDRAGAEFAERVERCAQKPIAQAMLSQGAIQENAPDLAGCARGLQAVNVMLPDGRLLAQWPPTKTPILGKNYAFRDYFRGARSLAEHALPGAYLGLCVPGRIQRTARIFVRCARPWQRR